MVYKCQKATGDEKTVPCADNCAESESVSVNALRLKFDGSKAAMDFFDSVEDGIPRYKTAQLQRINTVSKNYSSVKIYVLSMLFFRATLTT